MPLLWANHTWGHTTHLYQRQHWLWYLGTTLLCSLQFHPLCEFQALKYATLLDVLTILSSLTLPPGVCQPHSILHSSQTFIPCHHHLHKESGEESQDKRYWANSKHSLFFSVVALDFSIYCALGGVHTLFLTLIIPLLVGSY